MNGAFIALSNGRLFLSLSDHSQLRVYQLFFAGPGLTSLLTPTRNEYVGPHGNC